MPGFYVSVVGYKSFKNIVEKGWIVHKELKTVFSPSPTFSTNPVTDINFWVTFILLSADGLV